MKLRRQTPAKAAIAALTAGLLAALFAVVRSEPRIAAEPAPVTPDPGVDYQRFFAPAAPAPDSSATPAVVPRPHTRTRAS
jgi:hypothetical protein